MTILRFEIKDNYGEFRVFIWDKITGRVGILKKGYDLYSEVNPKIFGFKHDPVYNMGDARLLAREFLHSGISEVY